MPLSVTQGVVGVRGVRASGGGDADAVLARNLACLGVGSPQATERVRNEIGADELIFVESEEKGVLSATADGVALCSRRRPTEEARRFAESVDLRSAGVVVVLGFGLGHHVRALVERVRGRAAVVVFEPDGAMLRSVLERVDCTAWLGRRDVIVLTEARDLGGMSRSMHGLEPMVAMGTAICEHVPSRSRVASTAGVFLESLAQFVGTVRMHVITTLVQSDVTVRNVLMSLDHYATRAGIDDLAGAGQGRAAVVVSAGPSLKRNLHLLAEPGVRDRVVIIAAQTVLRPMLAAGVKPHFVTALDYHEISKRFYEGLTAEDVRGVALIAEAKVNPAVIEAWPGEVRIPSDDFAQLLLGDLARERGAIRAGATVAHLSYYLARHLGCDPVILVGQDLGFTDGQYYAKGAAIHDVWAGELNAFNTLEMMEWQRIARNRGHLHKAQDDRGRTIYTDDQMRAYLAQFERDFSEDAARGLAVIDATEGGVRKAHTDVKALREALAESAGAGGLTLPSAACGGDAARKRAVLERVKTVKRDVARIAEISRETTKLLSRMQQQHDETELNRLIDRAHRLRDEVKSIEPAWSLLHRVNQAGAFNRLRADRLIAADDGLSAREVQVKRIERDLTNVRWIAESAEVLEELLGATVEVFEGGARRTRDLTPRETAGGKVEVGAVAVRAAAVVLADHETSGIGIARDLDEPIAGRAALTRTIERVARCGRIERIIVLSTHPERARKLLPMTPSMPIDVVSLESAAGAARRASIARARAWASECWRGGLGFTTCYDEALDAEVLHATLERAGLDAALIVGGDWCLVDPALCDAVLERHAEHPEQHALAFTQAAPGLAGCVVSRSLAGEIAKAGRAGSITAHLGGAVGYVPRSPRNDPIAKSHCVTIDLMVRDAGTRVIGDTRESRAVMERVIREMGDASWDAARIGAAVRRICDERTPDRPAEITIEIASDDAFIDTEAALRLFARIGEEMPDAAVTIRGTHGGDALSHTDCERIVRAASEHSAGRLHVRTGLRCDAARAAWLTRSGVGAISIDMVADTRETYLALTGRDEFERLTTTIEAMLRAQERGGGVMRPWIVPRMLRCDAVCGEVESFFDRWTHFAGAAVIDQSEQMIEGDRIEPLGKPKMSAWRDWRRRMVIRVDGRVACDEFDAESWVGDATKEALSDVWARLMRIRDAAWRERGIAAHECRTGW